tara:strand:- start:57 stop:488 length:432 start_codon:yes stop_codon:yes gene_type:complete
MIKKIETSFNNQPFMKIIGAHLGEIRSGYCEIILPFNKKITQQHGLIHGGILSTLADNSSAFAAFSLMKEPLQPLTIELKINYLSQTICNSLIAKAEVIRAGNSITHAKSEIFSIFKNKETIIACSIATIKSSKKINEIKKNQ